LPGDAGMGPGLYEVGDRMRRAWRATGVLAGALAAGALTVAALRVGWLLQWPRTLLAGLLVAAAVAPLALLSLADDLVGPGRWPDPPEPERVAGWPQLALVAGALRKSGDPRKRGDLRQGGDPRQMSVRNGRPDATRENHAG
jgi:hypothetical protein